MGRGEESEWVGRGRSQSGFSCHLTMVLRWYWNWVWCTDHVKTSHGSACDNTSWEVIECSNHSFFASVFIAIIV